MKRQTTDEIGSWRADKLARWRGVERQESDYASSPDPILQASSTHPDKLLVRRCAATCADEWLDPESRRKAG